MTYIEKPITFHDWKFPKGNLFDNIVFPLVRRVAAQLIGLDLVPVQPMGPPRPMVWGDFVYNRQPIKWKPKKPQSWQSWMLQKKWEKSGLLDGLKGLTPDANDLGLVYAPYIPLFGTTIILEENEFAPRRQLNSRYAQAVVHDTIFGDVTHRHLNL